MWKTQTRWFGSVAVIVSVLILTAGLAMANQNASKEFQMWFMEPKDIHNPYGKIEFRASALRYLAPVSSGGSVAMIRAVVPQTDGMLLPGASNEGWWLYGAIDRKEGNGIRWSIVRYFSTDGVRLYGPLPLYEEFGDRWYDMFDLVQNEKTGEFLFLKFRRGDIGFALYAYASEDGQYWKKLSDKPVYHDHDVLSLFWDSRTERYIAYQTTYQTWPKRYPDNLGDHTRRVLHIRTSKDGLVWDPSDDVSFSHWPAMRVPTDRLIVPNEADPEEMEFYFMTVFTYADRYVAMVLNYAPSPQEVNPVDFSGHGPLLSAEWWTSDDGLDWRRPYQGQDVIGEAPTTIRHSPMEVEDQLRWVVGGNTYFVDSGRMAGAYSKANGEFSSEIFIMPSSPLLLNASVKHPSIPQHNSRFGIDLQGYIMVELLDRNGRVIPGYEREKATFIDVDNIRLPLRWAGKDATELAGQPVQLRFYFRDATIYSISTADQQ